jgi:hypothetical protein
MQIHICINFYIFVIIKYDSSRSVDNDSFPQLCSSFRNHLVTDFSEIYVPLGNKRDMSRLLEDKSLRKIFNKNRAVIHK